MKGWLLVLLVLLLVGCSNQEVPGVPEVPSGGGCGVCSFQGVSFGHSFSLPSILTPFDGILYLPTL